MVKQHDSIIHSMPMESRIKGCYSPHWNVAVSLLNQNFTESSRQSSRLGREALQNGMKGDGNCPRDRADPADSIPTADLLGVLSRSQQISLFRTSLTSLKIQGGMSFCGFALNMIRISYNRVMECAYGQSKTCGTVIGQARQGSAVAFRNQSG